MAQIMQLSCDAANTVVDYLQTLRVVEIRQSLEFIGLYHIEVIIAVFIFLMLQFTKFTAVLLIACLIAFAIFYMWESFFPELDEHLSRHNKYPATYGAGYGPPYGPKAVAAASDFPPPYYPTTGQTSRDARTSALFPPFSNYDNEDSTVSPEKRQYLNSIGNHLGSNLKKSSPSGAATPIGHRGSSSDLRAHRRPYTGQIEDFKNLRRANDRDAQAFRRMITNEYRAYRPGTVTETNLHRHANQTNDDQRSRRNGPPNMADDRAYKNRRGTENKSSTQKKSNTNEQLERSRNVSRENMLRKLRNYPGPPARTSGTHSRSDPSGPNAENRGVKRRADNHNLFKFKLNRWGL
ncbi:uncharacterized protein [Drosophila virilis]|uniref:Uncharacterized protein, isoform B n=1 Tax=Drosophila virilis TaxID=7244 RepID=A0A0Q9WDM5_DROVI|nr:uncharacterized protein LOC6632436 isoform X2 [Drosophila virilis]KRF78773.1 uncharacterized protein Dvir_GJ10787, isoform B [Drosophila virilis]